MNPAAFCIRKETISWLSVLVILIGGYISFNSLGRYEDPEFIIRSAAIVTQYPGASAQQVAEEVTDPIEAAIQQLQEVKKITSVSRPGESEVQVEMQMRFAKTRPELEQIWDKLRRKVQDAQRQLPPGAAAPFINDDYGDVFALFFALTGEGFTSVELKDYADDLRKELLLVDGVAKVALYGAPQEAIFIEISRAKAAQLGVPLSQIYASLREYNILSNAGDTTIDATTIRITPTGDAPSVESLSQIRLNLGSAALLTLGDIADIRREVREPARTYLRFNGQPAIGIGISNMLGGNIVATGENVKQRLAEIEANRPLGMNLNVVSYQSDTVQASIDNFILNLLSAIAIVIVVLLLFMGLRSGLIIGFVLLLIVAGTLIAMRADGIDMHRISLGALIIALGMLVDNAIVVTDSMLTRLQAGQDRFQAAKEVVTTTIWPLLGGTAVGILAFSAIGFSPSSMGEYVGSLFWVIAYSLFLSWVFAITLTPLLCYRFLKVKPIAQGRQPTEGFIYTQYRKLLGRTLNWPVRTLAVLGVLMLLAVFGFRFVPPGFMPDSARPQFVIDYWMPQGTDIDTTSAGLKRLEAFVEAQEHVTNITSFIGSGGPRFMLTYVAESANPAYGQLLVDVTDFKQLPALIDALQAEFPARFPEANVKAWKFMLGKPLSSKIEAVFRGPDPTVLRALAEQAKAIMAKDPDAVGIKDDWRNRVPVLRPVLNEVTMRRAGLTKSDINTALRMNFSGDSIGVFRDGSDLLPIIARAPEAERNDPDAIGSIMVFSPAAGRNLPLSQFISGFETVFEDVLVRRQNRFAAIKAQCDPPAGELAGPLFSRIRPQIEAIELPPGYALAWDGEYEASRESNAGLAASAPYGFAAMILAVVLMFNALKQPLVIWLTAPLAIIGVTFGLLVFQAPFEFMAILGFLSLIGMLVKNAIVLVDQIDFECAAGKPLKQAIIDSAISRMRPVAMGAITTILGVAPLLLDPFFRSMTVVIMFGLTFATVLTLVVVPVNYLLFFRKRSAGAAALTQS